MEENIIYPTYLKKYSGYITVIKPDLFKVKVGNAEHTSTHPTVEEAFTCLRKVCRENDIHIDNLIYGPFTDDKGNYYEVEADGGRVQFSEEDMELIQKQTIRLENNIPKFVRNKIRVILAYEIMGTKEFVYRDGKKYNLRRSNLITPRDKFATESEYY
jgi:hypothetical protein